MHRKKPRIFNIGTPTDLTFPYEHLGPTASVLDEILAGNHSFNEDVKNAKTPLMILGRDALTRKDSEGILKRTKLIANQLGFVNAENGWNGYNILQRSQGETNAL